MTTKGEQVLVRALSPYTLKRRFGSQETQDQPKKKRKKKKIGLTKKRNRSLKKKK